MNKVTAVKPMLLLKRVRQASTAIQQRQRISATIVKLENQVHKERSNVEHGTNIFFSLSFFLVREINASIFLSSSPSLFSLVLFSHPTVTRENLTLPLPAKHVPSAQPASFKIKTPTQVFRAKRVRQDTTAPSPAPRRALILVASNPKIAKSRRSTLMTRVGTKHCGNVWRVLKVSTARHRARIQLYPCCRLVIGTPRG